MEGMYYGFGCLIFIIVFGVITAKKEIKDAQNKKH